MIAEVLKRKNLYAACQQVVGNKGAAGIDGMTVYGLGNHLEANRDKIITEVLNHTYVPDAIPGVELPGGNGKNPITGYPDSNSEGVTTSSEPGAKDQVRVGL